MNSKVKSEVYVKQPQGFEDKPDKLCKLQKALYGLRESPRAWFECFDELMKRLGFENNKIDNCLYSMVNGRDKVYIILFVDDLFICCKSQKTIVAIDMIKRKLLERFHMKDLGKVTNYLGLKIDYNVKSNEMFLSQKSYIESLANNLKMRNCMILQSKSI